jgi:hypothetical protein
MWGCSETLRKIESDAGRTAIGASMKFGLALGPAEEIFRRDAAASGSG